MRILNLSILLLMLLILSCDKNDGNFYDKSDKDSNSDSDVAITDEDTGKSDEGGPCKKSSDCLPYL